MIVLPIKAEVQCSDGIAGLSTYVIGNPANHKVTNLVVKSLKPPFQEYLVPLSMVAKTMPHLIKLNITLNELEKLDPFEYEEYIRNVFPTYITLPYSSTPLREENVAYTPVKVLNIPADEAAVRAIAKVEATDGFAGQVDELLIDSTNMQITHLVLLEGHVFNHREVTIPVSQIKHVYEDTIYLLLDKKSIEELPTAPIQRWKN